MPTSVRHDDLEDALYWASSGAPYENRAFLSRETGEFVIQSARGAFADESPDDLEDGSLYIEVPHKNELDLGRRLALSFVDDVAPSLSQVAHSIFRHRGACAQFKDLLDRNHLLDQWFEYERNVTRTALAAWAGENGFEVTHDRGAA